MGDLEQSGRTTSLATMPDDDSRLHTTWIDSDRQIPSRFMRPLLKFTHVEAAGGALLLVAAVAALAWANAPFGETYDTFWNAHLTVDVSGFHFDHSLKDIVNDALMVIFFFVVGLEIKRELVVGDLRDPRRAALPAIAAVGGMLVPALIFVFFVIGTSDEAIRGWGIPMATDIAFSLAVVSLLGARISVGAKLFLLALAIADDIGAIAVIAIFYTDDLAIGWLSAGIVGLVLVWVARRAGIRSLFYYTVAGIAVWFFVFQSGVHATLAGVALGLMTPVVAWYSDEQYYARSKLILNRYQIDAAGPRSRERVDHRALALAAIARESVSPLDRLEQALHPWSSFVIIPIFALANAGVRFVEFDTSDVLTNPVTLGVAYGLVVGKVVGISGAAWIAVRTGVGRLPARTGWTQIIGLSLLAGIGFTVSLFITDLAFTDELLSDAARIGIFIGSTVAGLAGYTLLRRGPTPQGSLEDGRTRTDTDDTAKLSALDRPTPTH